MVELRPYVPGFYKGLIYCSSLGEAEEVASLVQDRIEGQLKTHSSAKIKRGCSEFPIAFPEYEKLENPMESIPEFSKNWAKIERSFDEILALKL